jgi:hypothetical protein
MLGAERGMLGEAQTQKIPVQDARNLMGKGLVTSQHCEASAVQCYKLAPHLTAGDRKIESGRRN